MAELLELHRRAMQEFGRRVHAVEADQWHERTACTDWDVHTLVNHLVSEQLWVPPLLNGARMADVGDRYDGDQLGDDPAGAWDRASHAAREAWIRPGALDQTVHLSFGESPATLYCWQMTLDLGVHAWDLARGIGAEERIDPELGAELYAWILPQAEEVTASGMFAPPVSVPGEADDQSKLFGLLGRHP